MSLSDETFLMKAFIGLYIVCVNRPLPYSAVFSPFMQTCQQQIQDLPYVLCLRALECPFFSQNTFSFQVTDSFLPFVQAEPPDSDAVAYITMFSLMLL